VQHPALQRRQGHRVSPGAKASSSAASLSPLKSPRDERNEQREGPILAYFPEALGAEAAEGLAHQRCDLRLPLDWLVDGACQPALEAKAALVYAVIDARAIAREERDRSLLTRRRC